MPKETQRGYLSGVLQRGARIVGAANRTKRRPSFSLDSGRAFSSTPPLEIETLSSSPANKYRPAVTDNSSQLQPAGATQKTEGGSTPTESAPSAPEPDSSVTAIARPVERSPQIPAGEQTIGTTSLANQSLHPAEPIAPKKVTPTAIVGEAQFPSATIEAKTPGGTASSEPKITPSLRVRDRYPDVRRASLPESEIDQADFDLGSPSHLDEAITSKTLSPGPSRQPDTGQSSFGAPSEIPKAEPKRAAELTAPQNNSANVSAAHRQARAEAILTDDPSGLALPRAERATEVLGQPTPQLTESIFSQRPPYGNPASRAPAPRLMINRLDIQIVDQTPPQQLVAPMRQAPQPDGAENIERYQLGHIDLIF